jgi:hypothetical protein
MTKRTLMPLIIGIAVIGVSILIARTVVENREPSDVVAQRYISDFYGFSFDYPTRYHIREYLPERISIGQIVQDGFIDDALVSIEAGGEEGYGSYDEYLFDRTRQYCAADSPVVTISCDQIEQRQPFTTNSGLTGDAFYLRRVEQSIQTGQSTTTSYGPLFAFNITPNTQHPYAALIIHPPLASTAADTVAPFIQIIAETVTIQRVENRQ